MKKKVRLPLMLVFVSIPTVAMGAGMVSYQQYGRLNTPAFAEASSNWVGIELDGKSDKRQFGYKYDLQSRVTPGNERGAIFSVPEAYIKTSVGRSDYSLGRKIVKWQPNEKFWGTGHINGVRSFNLLEQDQEGIMAAHFERSTGNYDLGLFASYIHVPQVNPTFSDKDGKVIGKNEWSNPPPAFVRFNQTDVPIYYTIQYPTMQEIVAHESLGAYGAYKWKGGKVATYATYKPENQIRINASGFYEQSPNEQVVVRAKPFINHHMVFGSGVEQKFGAVNWTNYVDVIRPQRESDQTFKFEGLKIEPVYTDETIYTTSLSYRKPWLEAGVHYLKLLQGDERNTNTFAKKPKWRNAVGGYVSYLLTDHWDLMVDMKYDLNLQDSTVKNELGYRFSKHARIAAGLELIESPKQESFWSAYRANDTVYSNLSYLF